MANYKIEDFYVVTEDKKIIEGFYDHKMPILDKSEEEITLNILKWAESRNLIETTKNEFRESEIKKWFLYLDEMESDIQLKISEVLTKFRKFKESISYIEGSGTVIDPYSYVSRGRKDSKKHARNDDIDTDTTLNQRSGDKVIELHGFAPVWIEAIYALAHERVEWIKDKHKKGLFLTMLEKVKKKPKDFPAAVKGEGKITYMLSKENYEEFLRLLHQCRDDCGIHESFVFPFNPTVFYTFGEIFGYLCTAYKTRYKERLQFSTRQMRRAYDETSFDMPVGNDEEGSKSLIDFVTSDEAIWGESLEYTSDKRLVIRDMIEECSKSVLKNHGEMGHLIFTNYIECRANVKELEKCLEEKFKNNEISRKVKNTEITKVVVYAKRFLKREDGHYEAA